MKARIRGKAKKYMNKRILISLSVIGAVAAIAVGGTIAYFSDTEESIGNTFTAGKLDLIFRVNGQDVGGDPLFTELIDLKPGDSGEKTVSLWVDNNPACGKVAINVTEDLDNDCTEPEGIDEPGDECGVEGGELNDQVNFLVWKDDGAGSGISCDNIKNGDEEELVSGPLTESVVYSMGELPTTETCYGIAYCFGTWVDGTCDGQNVDNAAQTDSFEASLVIDALQKRHQFPEPDGCPPAGIWPADEGGEEEEEE